jgi:membrane-associated phospholipid phosphatase
MMKTPFGRFTTITYTVVCVLLIGISAIVPKGDDVFFINGHYSALSDAFFSIITHLGSGYIFVPLVIYLLFVQFRYAILAAVIWISHGLVCSIIKKVFFRGLKRPKALLDNDLLHFVPHVEVPTLFSFPSGHTATIFCITVFLSLFLKNRTWTLILLTIALIVGYSRVYLLQHFLMDVAAGTAIGIGVTYFWWGIFEGNSLPPWTSYSLRINVTTGDSYKQPQIS